MPFTHWFTNDLLSPMASASAFWLPPQAAMARAIGVLTGLEVERCYTRSQAPLVVLGFAPLYRESMNNGESFRRYLQPKIKALGLTDEKFAIDRMQMTKGAVSSWWRTGKISKQSLNKISQMLDLDAPLNELMAALEGRDVATMPSKPIEATAKSAVSLAENVRRMVRYVPNYRTAAERAGINPEVLESPDASLRNATLLDLDLVAEALNTKPWLLLHPHSKNLDKRLDFVEELLQVVAETNDEGREAIVNAMKLARRIGQLTAPPSATPEEAEARAAQPYLSSLRRQGVIPGAPERRQYKPVTKK